MYTSFLNNTVPTIWKKVGYSSLKPLSSWYKDMKDRVAFISEWFNKQNPNAYWMSGFFFPQGFLTGVLQTHARKYKIPIDTLNFKYRTIDTDRENFPLQRTEYISMVCILMGPGGIASTIRSSTRTSIRLSVQCPLSTSYQFSSTKFQKITTIVPATRRPIVWECYRRQASLLTLFWLSI
jgi:hypothetical protein